MAEITGTDTPGTVVARPGRRPLAVLVPLAGAALALCVLASGQRLTATSGVTGVAALLCGGYGLVLLRGRTVAGPDGIGNRLFARERRIPWADLRGLEIRPSPFGHVVRAVLRDGRTVELAAPRTAGSRPDTGFDETVAAIRAAAPVDLALVAAGKDSVPARFAGGWRSLVVVLLPVLALASAFDRPWDSPFWPGRHEASRLPDACAVLSRPPATALVPGGLPDRLPGGPGRSACFSDHTTDGRTTHLQLRYDLTERYAGWGGSGSAVAHRLLTDRRSPLSGAAWRPLGGVGDECSWTVRNDRDGHSWVTVIARRANVVVTVDYTTQAPAAQTAGGAQQTARAALDSLHLG